MLFNNIHPTIYLFNYSVQAVELNKKQQIQWMNLAKKRFYSERFKILKTNPLPCPLKYNEQVLLDQFNIELIKNKTKKIRSLVTEKERKETSNSDISEKDKGVILTSNYIPFKNLSNHTFSEKEIKLLEKGPNYIPEFALTNKSKLQSISMIEASMQSLSCQTHIKLQPNYINNQINNKDQNESIFDTKWKYIPAYRRKIPHLDEPIESIEREINRLKQELIHTVNKYINNDKRNNKFNSKDRDENKIIRNLKKLPVVLMPSDKTKKLIALNSEDYSAFSEEHKINYDPINKVNLPMTEQNTFNKALSKVASKYEEPMKSLLLVGKCKEPIPSIMYFLPKDHKEILKGRPIVNSSDAPGTTLCKIMSDIIKPLLRLIPAHLKDSSDFIREIKKHKWEDGDYFGSLDVTYLYGSIPLVGPNNVIDIASDFFEKKRFTRRQKIYQKMTLKL